MNLNAKDVATDALKSFSDTKISKYLHNYRTRDHAAIVGFLQGVASGIITVGQSWPAEILRATEVHSADKSTVNSIEESEYDLLQRIFASGMCCEGQILQHEREKTFVERAI